MPYRSRQQPGYKNLDCEVSHFAGLSRELDSKLLVSAIIPARNEEVSIARAVESVAAQAEIGEVIVVNDQSTDRTGEILSELSKRITKLKILATGILPPGWTGKNYAVSIGAAAARGDWLLFTDADTYHLPGSMQRALDDATTHSAALVSYSPEQEMETSWERALIPFVYCRLAAKYSYARVNDPSQPDAAANGQYLLIKRDAYDAIGGHAAVASEILEDVVLASKAKKAGYGIYFTSAFGLIHTRMYRTFGAMWLGWTKNLYRVMGGTSRSAARELFLVVWRLGLTIAFLLWLLLLRKRAPAIPTWLVIILVAGAVFVASIEYGVELHKNLFPISYIKYYIPAVCLYSAMFVVSWWKTTRGSVVWKGRTYPAKTP